MSLIEEPPRVAVGLAHTEAAVLLGAAQRVWETTFLGRPVVLKQRFEKKYRHEALDRKLTVSRMKQVAQGPDVLANRCSSSQS